MARIDTPRSDGPRRSVAVNREQSPFEILRRPDVATAALTLLTVAIYLHAPDLGFMATWDDTLYLVDRPEVRRWFSVSWRDRLLTPGLGYPVPIPTFVHYLLRRLPSDWVVPAAHLVNLAVHLGNVLLAYHLARRWTESAVAALLAAAGWASHPLLVETVAWLTNFKGLLSGTFVFGTLICWDAYCRSPTPGRAIGAGACIVGALGCRPEGIVLLPLCLGQLYLRRPEALSSRRTWSVFGPLSGLGLLYVVRALRGQAAVLSQNNLAVVPSPDLFEQLTRMGAALTIQLRHTLVPTGLNPSYPRWYDGIARDAWIGLGLFAALVTTAVVAIRHRPKSGYGWSIWWAFYLPASGIAVLPRLTADTYMYLPLFGLVLAAAEGLTGLFAAQRRRLHQFGLAAAAIGIALSATAAHFQTLRWRTPLTLWQPVHQQRPEALRPAWMVAGAYVEAGEYEKAIRLYDDFYDRMMEVGRVPLNMAAALEKTGRPRDAVDVLVDILEYDGVNHPRTEAFFLELVVNHDLDLGGDAHARNRLLAAADRLLTDKFDHLDADLCRRAAAYFLRRDHSDLAARFTRGALERAPENCRHWQLHDRLSPPARPSLPDRPSNCR